MSAYSASITIQRKLLHYCVIVLSNDYDFDYCSMHVCTKIDIFQLKLDHDWVLEPLSNRRGGGEGLLHGKLC